MTRASGISAACRCTGTITRILWALWSAAPWPATCVMARAGCRLRLFCGPLILFWKIRRWTCFCVRCWRRTSICLPCWTNTAALRAWFRWRMWWKRFWAAKLWTKATMWKTCAPWPVAAGRPPHGAKSRAEKSFLREGWRGGKGTFVHKSPLPPTAIPP